MLFIELTLYGSNKPVLINLARVNDMCDWVVTGNHITCIFFSEGEEVQVVESYSSVRNLLLNLGLFRREKAVPCSDTLLPSAVASPTSSASSTTTPSSTSSAPAT